RLRGRRIPPGPGLRPRPATGRSPRRPVARSLRGYRDSSADLGDLRAPPGVQVQGRAGGCALLAGFAGQVQGQQFTRWARAVSADDDDVLQDLLHLTCGALLDRGLTGDDGAQEPAGTVYAEEPHRPQPRPPIFGPHGKAREELQAEAAVSLLHGSALFTDRFGDLFAQFLPDPLAARRGKGLKLDGRALIDDVDGDDASGLRLELHPHLHPLPGRYAQCTDVDSLAQFRLIREIPRTRALGGSVVFRRRSGVVGLSALGRRLLPLVSTPEKNHCCLPFDQPPVDPKPPSPRALPG